MMRIDPSSVQRLQRKAVACASRGKPGGGSGSRSRAREKKRAKRIQAAVEAADPLADKSILDPRWAKLL